MSATVSLVTLTFSVRCISIADDDVMIGCILSFEFSVNFFLYFPLLLATLVNWNLSWLSREIENYSFFEVTNSKEKKIFAINFTSFSPALVYCCWLLFGFSFWRFFIVRFLLHSLHSLSLLQTLCNSLNLISWLYILRWEMKLLMDVGVETRRSGYVRTKTNGNGIQAYKVVALIKLCSLQNLAVTLEREG